MRAVSNKILDELDLLDAVEAEAVAARNQLPPEPWVGALSAQRVDLSEWVRERLWAGLPVVPNAIVNARKASLGTRPIPIMGVTERIAFRALTARTLSGIVSLDRSADAYKAFLLGPIIFALEEQDSNGYFPRGYVVEADITAFYEYIDHDLMKQELELQTGDIEGVDLLVELLTETEQKSFGLPQLLDASDWLSEVYIRIVERSLARSGWPTWRFNDDFRIACHTYTEALDAIEQLEVAARSAGLTVNAYKTHTPSFETYVLKNTGRNIDRAIDAIDPTDVEAVVVEYATVEDAQQIESAIETLSTVSAGVSEPDPKRVTGENVRHLRRAINSITYHRDERGLDFLRPLFEYVPSLTPRLCDYLVAVGTTETRKQVISIVDDVLRNVPLGEWQAQWFTYVCRHLNLLDPPSDRLEWVRSQLVRGRGKPLGAEAALALAEVGAADFGDLDIALRVEPEALAPWFLLAMKSMASLDPQKYRNRARAVRDSSPFNRLLLDI